MRNREASQAVRDQNHIRPGSFYCVLNRGDPVFTNRIIPIALLDADETGIGLFPKRLPMQRAGVPDAGEDKYGRRQFSLQRKKLVICELAFLDTPVSRMKWRSQPCMP